MTRIVTPYNTGVTDRATPPPTLITTHGANTPMETLFRCIACDTVFMREQFTDFRYIAKTGLVVKVERCPKCHRDVKKRRFEVVPRERYNYIVDTWLPNGR